MRQLFSRSNASFEHSFHAASCFIQFGYSRTRCVYQKYNTTLVLEYACYLPFLGDRANPKLSARQETVVNKKPTTYPSTENIFI